MNQEDVSILVIDDVNSIRQNIKELLKSFGFRKVTLAANGEEAKRALDQDAFQLILCDWQMTPTDGVEFLKYTRAHPKYKDVAFILVTGENKREKVIVAVEFGVDDYLVKPLTIGQIQDKVYRTLVRKKVIL